MSTIKLQKNNGNSCTGDNVEMKPMNDTVDAQVRYESLISHDEDSRVSVNSKSSTFRFLYFHQPLPQKYCDNSVSTAKYNFFSFIPKFLFEQFRRYSNIFFLGVALLQQIPNVSPTGKFTTIVPLVFILTISAIKEIVEDFKRHLADDATNNSGVSVLRDGSWHEIKSKDIQVGDFCKLHDRQHIPADMVLLASSEPLAMCYIETSNLDGETNLKIRQGLPVTANCLTTQELLSLQGSLECIPPNRHLYDFMGNITLHGQTRSPLKIEQLLLRGSSIRNTRWAFGVVVYTGHDTKVMLNSTAPPLKHSTMEIKTNRHILALFVLLTFLTFSVAIANVVWTNYNQKGMWYLILANTIKKEEEKEKEQLEKAKEFAFMLLTAFIMFHTIIPISLQVTLEIVRFVQAFFINWDLDMYDKTTDTPAMARTSNLNEELGQVKYIFSDKTGTLTRNVMEFKRCSIAGQIFGLAPQDYFALLDNRLQDLVEKCDPEVDMFFTLLAVCHTVIPEKDPDDPTEIAYQASSPDENALVKAARKIGYVFSRRTPEGVSIVVRGQERHYELLNVLEFTSDRKRMSVIVRGPDNKIRLLLKGADSVIYERLHPDSKYCQETLDHLQEFANSGLRTLCLAHVEVDATFYSQWLKGFQVASTALTDRDGKVAKAAEEIEQNLYLIGATAIEDKLQEGVPETIANLMKAGIKVWILTGDKQETAINIGYSCRLLTQSMSLLTLTCDSLEQTRAILRHHINEFGDQLGRDNDVGLIIDGETLIFALSRDCRSNFLQLSLSCKAVICCRVSPLQKAEVVNMVREKDRYSVTLAIGDGANDVGMIQAAHVGIGISGMEGLQAACASDYTIAQFRFLCKLLLVHGAWSYQRLAKLILYSFYKNICLFMVLFWFSIINGFSGQIVFERWSMGFYNLFFSAAPAMALGMFDRSCSNENRLKYPQLYKESQTSSTYNFRVFLCWVVNSIYHSAVIFWLSILSDSDVCFGDGQVGSLFFLGFRVYTFVVITVCLKAGLEHTAWTWLSHLAIWGSVVTWFAFVIGYSHVWPYSIGSAAVVTGMDIALFRSALFWFGMFIIPTVALTRDVAWKAFMRTCAKTLRDQVMELEQLHVDPGNVILTETSRMFSEKVPLFKVFKRGVPTTSRFTWRTCEMRPQLGYAFSQEEHGAVRQSDLVRRYDSTIAKPEGI